jgi:glutamate-1-semialdehyde aminotransferase
MKFNPVLGERENFGFQNYDVVPMLLYGKGMGGGMPVGALPHQPMMDLLVIIQNWDISPLWGTLSASACLATARNY